MLAIQVCARATRTCRLSVLGNVFLKFLYTNLYGLTSAVYLSGLCKMTTFVFHIDSMIRN
jgi:hypothetical protein